MSGVSGGIREVDAVEFDEATGFLAYRRAPLPLIFFLLGVEKFEDSLGGGDAGLEHLHHAGDLAEGLVHLAGVLDESGGVAEGELAGGDFEAAEHRDCHVRQGPDELHDRVHRVGQELRFLCGGGELFVAFVEFSADLCASAEDGGDVMAGEGFLDVAVQIASGFPLGDELLLRARSHQPDDGAGQRDREQSDEGELPGDGDHHDDNAHHGQQRVEQRREGLLECLLDVVDVVGGAAHDIAALPGVEVGQREAVDLRFDAFAQVEHGAHGQPIEDRALGPHEQRREQVEGEHHDDEVAEAVEVDAAAGGQLHRFGHVGEAVLACGAQALDGLFLGGALRQLAGDDAGEDHVHRVPHHARRPHGEDDGRGVHEEDECQRDLVRRKQPEQAFRGRPEVLGLAGGLVGVVVAGHGFFVGGELVVGKLLAHRVTCFWLASISR